MPKLSPREAVKVYQVSRATLMKALSDGTVSASKTDAGHWQIDPSELARMYQPRAPKKAASRTSPVQMDRSEPDQKAAVDHDLAARLVKAEAELAAEREKVDLLQRHLDDVRRMLPPLESAGDPALRKKLRSWWPW